MYSIFQVLSFTDQDVYNFNKKSVSTINGRPIRHRNKFQLLKWFHRTGKLKTFDAQMMKNHHVLSSVSKLTAGGRKYFLSMGVSMPVNNSVLNYLMYIAKHADNLWMWKGVICDIPYDIGKKLMSTSLMTSQLRKLFTDHYKHHSKPLEPKTSLDVYQHIHSVLVRSNDDIRNLTQLYKLGSHTCRNGLDKHGVHFIRELYEKVSKMSPEEVKNSDNQLLSDTATMLVSLKINMFAFEYLIVKSKFV